MEERRRAKRFWVWFPMRFEDGQVDVPQAVSRNVSQRGVLMATARKLEVGASVTLIFRITLEDPDEHVVSGKIVRCEPNKDDPHGMWPHWIAVEFDEPVPEIEPLIAEAAEQARHIE